MHMMLLDAWMMLMMVLFKFLTSCFNFWVVTKDNSESTLSINKKAISNTTMNLLESSILA
jgi:hypothetical protein